ncbi:MAG: hypothetical protein AB7T15_01725 [Desulfuromonas sp.]|jgi:hypothetical protein|nr:hypothetical protein [Desulfuromonas thiophila]MDD3801358.1 hypothetical protein [Desulfuromonas thiophila]MDY0398096.1 hypothetical protein [Desulfuromonas thiophila]
MLNPQLLDPQLYQIDSLTDEIRADQNCATLLRQIHQQLLQQGESPLQAGLLARGADYFLRDFLIGHRRQNILCPAAEAVWQFGGHWYIIQNLEPDLDILMDILSGVATFYRLLNEQFPLPPATLERLLRDCHQRDIYACRLEQFWGLAPDGYDKWRQDCPLPPLD